jgi:hypothetical protein
VEVELKTDNIDERDIRKEKRCKHLNNIRYAFLSLSIFANAALLVCGFFQLGLFVDFLCYHLAHREEVL